jgi:squalene cyclase
LRWAGSDAKLIARAAAAVVGAQRSDGGWAPLTDLPSDAYATGQALYALANGGAVPAADLAFQRGIRFLLSTQRADGSWHVVSRAVKFQPYFESGFPYGHEQWISAMATGWSSAALASALPAPAATAPSR